MSITDLNETQSSLEDVLEIPLDPAEIWHRSAPAAIRRAFSQGREDDGWQMWVERIEGRRPPESTLGSLRARICPLLWGLAEEPDGNGLLLPPPEKRAEDDPTLEPEVADYLDTASADSLGSGEALVAVGWARSMPRLAQVLPPKLWWALLERLLALSAQAARLAPADHALVHQLLAGEVAWTLGCLLPELAPCRALLVPARRALSRGLVDLLDGQGMPHGRHLDQVDLLAACWTRCAALAAERGRECFSAAARAQFEWLVRQLLVLSRADGTRAFVNGKPTGGNRDLLMAALELGGDARDRRIAARFLPQWRTSRHTRTRRRSAKSALPKSAACSEWARLAVLSPSWSPSAPRLNAAWSEPLMRLELSWGRDLLWSGPWATEVRFDGRAALPAGNWTHTCWVSDRDVDYLELRLQLDLGLRIERHVLLARDDGFLLLADAVLGGRAGTLDYRSCLPLRQGVAFQQARETHEGYLRAPEHRALVLPLALPEWRAEGRGDRRGARGRGNQRPADQQSGNQPRPGCGCGFLSGTLTGLELGLAAERRSLFAPLWFDLDPRRNRRRRTWRRLTVGQHRRIVADDVAAGFRIHVGNRQWLLYRALGGRGSRTLLGHHLTTEFLVARFDTTGQVEKLLEIE